MNAEREIDAMTTIPANPRRGIRDLHVKAIPEAVWIRARCNATQSGLSFKDYVIRLLRTCQPILDADAASPSS